MCNQNCLQAPELHTFEIARVDLARVGCSSPQVVVLSERAKLQPSALNSDPNIKINSRSARQK